MTTPSVVSHRSTTTRRTPPEHHRAATEVPRNSGHPLEIDDLPVAAPGRCLQLGRGVKAVQPLIEPCRHGHVAARGDNALVPGVLCRLQLGLNLSLGQAVHHLANTLNS